MCIQFPYGSRASPKSCLASTSGEKEGSSGSIVWADCLGSKSSDKTGNAFGAGSSLELIDACLTSKASSSSLLISSFNSFSTLRASSSACWLISSASNSLILDVSFSIFSISKDSLDCCSISSVLISSFSMTSLVSILTGSFSF